MAYRGISCARLFMAAHLLPAARGNAARHRGQQRAPRLRALRADHAARSQASRPQGELQLRLPVLGCRARRVRRARADRAQPVAGGRGRVARRARGLLRRRVRARPAHPRGVCGSARHDRDFFRSRTAIRSSCTATALSAAAAGVDEAQIGAAEHTDYGTITILWQDDVGGLQVKNRAGEWIDAPCIEDTFVINIGDMLARWSNDLFVSTPHRVVNTRDGSATPSRFLRSRLRDERRVPPELRVHGQSCAISAHRRRRLHHRAL